MKTKFLIFLVVLCATISAISQEFSEEQQQQLDSLNQAFNEAKEDSIKAHILLNMLGYFCWNNPDSALILVEKAVEFADKSSSGFGRCDGYMWFAFIHKIKGNYNQALTLNKKALPFCEEINAHNALSTLFNNLGEIYETLGDFDLAVIYLDKALALNEKYALETVGAIYGNLGNVYLARGEATKALEFYQKSVDYFETENDKRSIATSIGMIGGVYDNIGDLTKAVEYNDRALKMFEEINDKDGTATCLATLGNILERIGERDKALIYYKKSLEIYQEAGYKYGIANVHNNIGMVYMAMGVLDKAREHYYKSLELVDEIGDKRGRANATNNIGFYYNKIGKTDEAVEWYKKSLEVKVEIGDRVGECITLINISRVNFNIGNLTKAKQLALKGLDLAQQTDHVTGIMHGSQLLYEIYEKDNNCKLALNMHRLYINMRDSLNNEQTQKAAIKQQMNYEHDKQVSLIEDEQNKKDMIADQEKHKQQIMTYSFASGLGLVLLIAFVLFRSMNAKKKANEIIKKEKEKAEAQRDLVDEKNREILDSITYAQTIQSAILPPSKLVDEYLKDSFILFKPKDIVAGDFYWMERPMGTKGDNVYFAAADCTGHGVPGAMMSVMCSNALTKCVLELNLIEPAMILDQTAKIIDSIFERSERMVLDGMDLALCKLNLKTNELTYSGANNPLWLIRNEEIIETRADKQPIGRYDNRIPYSNHVFQLQEGDAIYIFSDGFVDQFGGAKGKKFKSKAFKQLLISIQGERMGKQLELVDAAFEKWRGSLEQVDDVCVWGVRV